ncbi:MAG: hypothetical protein C3F12_11595 [Candidatus Methylomirabilota bacterium]|nr:CBS domain-containing protein [Candidatus Methylomirabilis sp.]NJD69071.1 CBS domain-containing protein [candidate division NC10 bacterium]PWB43883.1 MAG: hypothetical protein C3F12_11595 [candidate division NC10 bacterium]
MRWSWRLGEVAGIAVYVHVTFLLLVGWVAISHWLTERSVAAALAGGGFILAGSQQDFPVVEGDRVEGMLLRSDLLAALASRGQAVAVAEVMRRNFQLVDSSGMLETAFTRLQGRDCHTLPVTHDGRLVGLVTMDNLGEFISIRTALGPRQPKTQSIAT